MAENIRPHESGALHVSGEALYVEDIPVQSRLLVGHIVSSPYAHARVVSFDLSKARRAPGIHAVLSSKEIPGHNQMGPVVHDEPCLAEDTVVCVGQAVFLIAGETAAQCRAAEKLIEVEYELLTPVLTLEDAIAKESFLAKTAAIARGDADAGLKKAPYRLCGELRIGAQEHWYLETQSSLCIPGEAGDMTVHSSSQHPSETQAVVAEVLGVGKHQVQVEVRRMGGGFGGKETQANHCASWAALLAHYTKRPVRITLDRDKDMRITGKRHRFLSRYSVGYNSDGLLLAVAIDHFSDGGCATDLSHAILERALLHSDNSYFVPDFRVTGRVCKTNLPSNTAFRGFGGPQGMTVIETIVDRVARSLQKDPAEVRRINFYGDAPRNTTHYEQAVEHNRLPALYDQLIAAAEYKRRRVAAREFNRANEFTKRGICMTPVKFGISFTTTFLNQAGALVHIYNDGTVLVNQGGTEMGQGLFTKMLQVAVTELGVNPSRVRINATHTGKVPNTSATAASSGADLNGMAVKNAIDILKGRIAEGIAAHFNESKPQDPTRPADIRFVNDTITDSGHPDRVIGFAQAMDILYRKQVGLSAAGFYRTPGIGWDKAAGRGTPFFYFAYGMAVTEVEVDTLTGDHSILRADILHDVGDSLNPAIDLGQIKGGFVQGNGWVTTEDVRWDDKGNLMTHSPDTYKIPTVNDIPKDFRVSLLADVPNGAETIKRSKAVGEPPLMLSLSTWLAIKDAIAAIADHAIEPEFPLPATNEVIILSSDALRSAVRSKRPVPA